MTTAPVTTAPVTTAPVSTAPVTTAPVSITPEISGPLLTRVGGLPTEALDLTGSATRRAIAEAADAHAELERRRPALEDACFPLVPLLDDEVPLRRQVLAAKRAAHRLRALPWGDELPPRIVELAGPEAAAEFLGWQAAVRLRDETARRLDALLTEDRAAAPAALAGHLADPGFVRAAALAAPDWLRHGRPRRRPAETRNLRTLYSYVSRAAVKTSPFSTLTTVGEGGSRGAAGAAGAVGAVGVAGVAGAAGSVSSAGAGSAAGSAGEGRRTAPVAHSYAATALAQLALRCLAREPGTAGLLRYRLAPLRPGGPDAPGGLVLLPEPVADGGLAWRLDRVVEADHAAPWLSGFANDAEHSLDGLLSGLGGPDPFRRFRRLLDTGLIAPVPPWRRGDDPVGAVAELLADHPEDGDGIAGEVRELRDSAAVLAAAGEDERTETLTRARRTARRWARRAGLDRFDSGEVLYEDVASDLALPELLDVPEVRADLTELGRRMRPFVFRSHLYDVLVDRFTAEYGPGGTCTDVLGFLMRVAVDGDAQPDLDKASVADRAERETAGERAWLPVGPSSAPPAAAVLFQLAATGPQAVRGGDYQLVVNQFNPGTGGLVTRFGPLLGEGFRDRLREHVRACWPGRTCRELVLWTEINTAQSRSAGLLPPLLLPGEVPADDGLDLTDTVLTHDPGEGTLALRDRTGDPVGLAYLGLVPPHLFPPFARLLAVLADPWVNGSPHSDYVLPFGLQERRTDEVVPAPRTAFGRVTVSRASWVVPAAELPLPRPGESDAETALRAEGFRRAHGLPEEVFCHRLTGFGPGEQGTDRKPLWVSLTSPLSLSVLAQWAGPATGHLRLVEALPARSAHPLRDAAGGTRAAEHIALLRWRRPEEEA
ncbi:lantibiotic dehydratase [Streptomyces sp. NPDC058664]|uniref:lantibiotic dehydratase n=1 Tax=unclassified Streptomyces TaxID=2593676 RepID=UPI00365CA376